MKKQFLKSCVLLSATFLLTGMFTSCVYDKDAEEPVPTGDGSLVININSTSVGSVTRSTSVGSSASAQEKTINTLVIGVFRPSTDATNANALVEFKYLTGLNEDISTATYSTTSGIKRPDAAYPSRTLSVQANDVVLAVCNVPADVATELMTATTADGFRQTAFDIDQALIFNDNRATDANPAGDGTYANDGSKSEDPAKLPMYGEGTVAAHATITGAFTTSITVRHIVAKITLASLKLETTDANYQFTPQQLFLTHVPEKADFYYSNFGSLTYGFNQTNTKFFQGEASDKATDDTNIYRDYLSTAALTGTLTKTAGDYGSIHSLYTMPAKPDNAKDTRLVLKGTWSTDGGSTSTPVYYPIKLYNSQPGALNGVGIYPNAHYVISLVIKRAGSTNAETDLDSNETVTGSISVSENWDVQDVTTEFGATGGTPTTTF